MQTTVQMWLVIIQISFDHISAFWHLIQSIEDL